MRKQRKTGSGHPFPERPITSVGGIDVLAIREAFHQNGAAFQATVQFVECVAPRWVNRDAGQEFGELFRKPEDDVIRDEHRAEIVARRSIRVVNALMSEQDDSVHGRIADESTEMAGINRLQISVERTGGKTQIAEDETGEPTVPDPQPQR